MNLDNQFKVYHLDNSVRGLIDNKKSRVDENLLQSLDCYKTRAILPIALLEYAGIQDIKAKFSKITSRLNEKNFYNSKGHVVIKNVKEELEKKLKDILPMTLIKEQLVDKKNWLSKRNKLCPHAEAYINACIRILPQIYDAQLIPQLSWDRITYMDWFNKIKSQHDRISAHRIIYDLGLKQNLYMLRFLNYENDQHANIKNLALLKNGCGLEGDKDAGDCELIHTAIHGIGFPQAQQPVHCYTMDTVDDIYRRLFLYFHFYYMSLNFATQHNLPKTRLDKNLFGHISRLDKGGRVTDSFDVKVVFQVHLEMVEIAKRGIACGIEFDNNLQ